MLANLNSTCAAVAQWIEQSIDGGSVVSSNLTSRIPTSEVPDSSPGTSSSFLLYFVATGVGTAPPAGPPPNPPPGVIPSCVKQVCIACAVAGSWKLGREVADRVMPAFFKQAVSSGFENAPRGRVLLLDAAGEAAGTGAELAVEVVPLVEDPDVVDFVDVAAPAAAAPVSVTRAESPATSDEACVGSSSVIVTVDPLTAWMVPVIRFPPNPPKPPAAAPVPVPVPPAAPKPAPPPKAARSEAKDRAPEDEEVLVAS